jgi:transcriptional regulator with XRE-family HTH domain
MQRGDEMNRIKELRLAAGLTQTELAELAGTTKNQLTKLEGGARRLSDHWADRLAPHLGIERHELFMVPNNDSHSSNLPAWAIQPEEIRSRMIATGVTQGQLADALGVHQSAVSNMLSGRRSLKASEAAIVADLLTQGGSAESEEQVDSDLDCDEGSDAMLDIAKRLRQRIHDLNLTQTHLARATGFSTARINNYLQLNERHNRTPDVRALIKLAKALRTTTDHILGLSDAASDDWKEVVARVLALEGVEQQKAARVVDVTEAALELLASLPSEGDPQTRAKLAAHAAWQMRASHSR